MKIFMALMALNIGGAETHVLELSKELTRMGHEVVVASAGGVYTKELLQSGIRHIRVPLHTKSPFAVMTSYIRLARILKREKFDIVHAHARIPAVILGWLQKRMHFHLVTSAHLNFKLNFLWRAIANWGERCIAVSEDIKEYLIREYGVISDHISLTINGIDGEKFSSDIDFSPILSEFSLDVKKRRIVYISRIDTDRSLPAFHLAEIAPRLYERYPDTEIVIVGGGNDFERLKKECDAANNSIGKKYITLAGARSDINVFVASSDIFIGVSRSALEAMAASKPTILSGNQGYLGIFDAAKRDVAVATNFCCRDCGDPLPDRLYDDIATLLDADKSALDAIGAYNKGIVDEFYSVRRMANDYLKMYDEVLPLERYRYGEVILSGYYGFGNMGDDSLLSCIIKNLREADPQITITVLAKNPSYIRRQFGVAAVNRYNIFKILSAMRHARLFINGGGNLLQNSTSNRSLMYYLLIMRLAKRCGLKLMIYANGIGPINGDKYVEIVKNALSDVDFISLRERESLQFASSIGLDISHVSLSADPVFTMTPADEQWAARLRRKFGLFDAEGFYAVSLRDFRTDREKKIAQLAIICKEIYNKYGYLPVFIPMQPRVDSEICRAVAKEAGIEYREITGVSGNELLALLCGMKFALSMRLHTLIFACAAGVVPIGFCYDPKIGAFVDTLDIPTMLNEEWSVTDVLDKVSLVLSDDGGLKTKMKNACERSIECSRADVAKALELLGS